MIQMIIFFLKQEPIKIVYNNIALSVRESRSLLIFGAVILIVFLMQMLENIGQIKWIIGLAMTLLVIVFSIFVA